MIRTLLLLVLASLMSPLLRAQTAGTAADPGLASLLNFEREPTGTTPAGWGGGPPGTIFVDTDIVHAGTRAARLERTAASPSAFSSLTKSLPMDFKGSRIELRGYLRTEDVSRDAGFWLREDGTEGSVEFVNMQRQPVKGTTDWKEYSISLPVNPAARTLFFGFLLNGTGKAWADDLQLLVDGKPVWEAPKAEIVLTVLDRDREFSAGSKIELPAMTPGQIENLAALGQIWGFLKYHHPKVTSGERHWDFELFRIMPAVLAAQDRAAANEVLLRWIEGLGELKPGSLTTPDPTNLHLQSALAWLEDDSRWGKPLGERLRAIHAARSADAGQFYVSMVRNVGNPSFDHELSYAGIKRPDAGYQLLALFRFWNIIRYWFPYRDLITDNWDAVLAEFIPRIGQAGTTDAYQLELIALIAKAHDTHANLWSSLRVRPPVGDSQVPVTLRFIEGRAVITAVATGDAASSLLRGDVVSAIGGEPVDALVKQWSPYYAASNEPTRLRDIARTLTRGPGGPVKLQVQRGNDTFDVDATRIPLTAASNPGGSTHDLPGPAFRLLSKDVAYLKLSAVKAAEAVSYVEQAAGTKGWVIDIRNYPSEFVVFALGSHFVTQPTDFVRFTIGDPANPGAFAFGKTLSLTPQAPHYPGKIVILIDEVTQSSAEYTTMAFRAAPQAIVIGSTTAAADGNVSRIPLPGGLQTMISGIGVFYPDKRPTQRVGIIPDLEVRPTLAGVRAGRDEVLEAGLRQILGPDVSAEEISKLAATHK